MRTLKSLLNLEELLMLVVASNESLVGGCLPRGTASAYRGINSVTYLKE